MTQNLREGGCRCGKVRFRLTAAPMVTAACHCSGCRRMTAGAYSLTATMPTSGFEVIEGETVIGGMHDPAQRHKFCGWCLSWLFTEFPGQPFVNVRCSLLDDPEGFAPFIEVMTAEKLSWAVTPARHSFERFPPEELYGALMAEYAGQG